MNWPHLTRCMLVATLAVAWLLPRGAWFDQVATAMSLAAVCTLLIDYVDSELLTPKFNEEDD